MDGKPVRTEGVMPGEAWCCLQKYAFKFGRAWGAVNNMAEFFVTAYFLTVGLAAAWCLFSG